MKSETTKATGAEGRRKFVVVYRPSDSDLFHIHAAGCADLAKAEREMKSGTVSGMDEVEAESARAAAEALLHDTFSDAVEHPATERYPGGSYGAAGFTYRILACCGRQKSAEPKPATEPALDRSAYAKACRAAEKAATAAGFAAPKGRGYWTALTVFCRANGIAHPATRTVATSKPEPKPEPTAAQLAEAKAAAKRAKHAKAERERRARVKARKAGRK